MEHARRVAASWPTLGDRQLAALSQIFADVDERVAA
jgi:hypothetical protein